MNRLFLLPLPLSFSSLFVSLSLPLIPHLPLLLIFFPMFLINSLLFLRFRPYIYLIRFFFHERSGFYPHSDFCLIFTPPPVFQREHRFSFIHNGDGREVEKSMRGGGGNWRLCFSGSPRLQKNGGGEGNEKEGIDECDEKKMALCKKKKEICGRNELL